MTIACKTAAEVEPGTVTINECGNILTSSTATFSWNDPNQTVSTIYDFWVGSMPLSNDIYDLAGGGSFNGSSVTVSNLPTDGRTIYKTLYVFANGSAGGITDTIQCTCTATTVLNADCMTFPQIAAAGPASNCYDENGIDRENSYLGEYLYQNPDVSDWEFNGDEICKLPDPEPSASAFLLPQASGGDDTAMVQAAINNNAEVRGQGSVPYRINSTIAVFNPTKIWDLPTQASGNQATQFSVTSSNVEFYRSIIDGRDNGSLKVGWLVGAVATDFVLSRSGARNFLTATGNMAGVWLRGGDRYKITCNEFTDLRLNGAASLTNISASALAVLNSNSVGATPGGYIANNYAENIHVLERSSGTTDPEFYRQQGYPDGTQSRPIIIANRCVNAGARLTKFQVSDGFVGSNFYHWRDRQGEFSRRVMKNVVNVQLGSDRVRAVNNRIKVEAEARYDAIFTVEDVGNRTFDDLHFDCNILELIDTPPQNFYANGLYLKENGGATNSTITNSSAKDNIWIGAGGTDHIIHIDSSWGGPLEPAGFDVSGNIVPGGGYVISSDYEGSGATYTP